MIDSMLKNIGRKFPFGAEVTADGGVHVRVWAPQKRKVKIVFTTNNEQDLKEYNLISVALIS